MFFPVFFVSGQYSLGIAILNKRIGRLAHLIVYEDR